LCDLREVRRWALLLLVPCFSSSLAAQEPAPGAPEPPGAEEPGAAEGERIPRARLVYVPGRYAAACPGERELQEAVTRRLGRSPFAEPAERIVVLTLDGDAPAREAPAAPTRARAELFGAALESLGVRELESREGCAELVEAAALAVSIALAPGLALKAFLGPAPDPVPVPVPVPLPEEEPEEEPEAPALSEPLVDDDPAGPAREDLPPSWLPEGAHLVVGLGTSFTVALAPQNVTGVHMTIAARYGVFELRIEQRQHVPGIDTTLGIFHGGSAWSLLPCTHLPLFALRGDGDRLGLMACASASAGNLWALGAIVGGTPHAGVGGRVGVEWTQADFSAFRLWGQTEWSVVRPEFITLTGDAWRQSSPISGILGVTWEVGWPP
jgi:hypothetical protein